MPTITAELSQKELDAIREYANLCGESISDLVRKALIREVTLADGYGADDPQYDYQMAVPGSSMRSKEHKIIQDNYNKIRKILGWREIRL
jgi:negative regulator of replication initiation